MSKYRFGCTIAMGNMSVHETEMQKKAIVNFLKAFYVTPSISKVQCGESKYDYYYDVDIYFESPQYLKVLRFSESLRSFCLYWQMSYIEEVLSSLDS